jgi:histidyl-tRNA synthetase
MIDISCPKGTYDILPEIQDSNLSWRQTHLWHFLEEICEKNAKNFGFQEIRTPFFERTELFKRSVGESSDIVSKEMYTFEDKGNRSMTLRPEMTASVIRCFIELNLHQICPLHKFYYLGPMFRYDRPQAGRYRQFYQFGVEAIGDSSPELDSEMIDLLFSICKDLHLKNLTLNINSVGDIASREQYSNALKEYLLPKKNHLSSDSQARLHLNTLRILDSKDAQDQELLLEAPKLKNFLTDESNVHFERVLSLLKMLDIPYVINPKLVRGLDYYNKTVFELTSGEIGSQNAIGGGGRYDGLMKTLKGPDLPSVGFAIGLERILQAMIHQAVTMPSKSSSDIFIIPIGENALNYCFKLLHEMRANGIVAEIDYSNKKLKDRLKIADQKQVKKVLIIGEDELSNDKATIKDMIYRTTRDIKLSETIPEIKNID